MWDEVDAASRALSQCVSNSARVIPINNMRVLNLRGSMQPGSEVQCNWDGSRSDWTVAAFIRSDGCMESIITADQPCCLHKHVVDQSLELFGQRWEHCRGCIEPEVISLYECTDRNKYD